MPKSFLNMAGYPLGLRNNNPGNIRTGDTWQGMIGSSQGFVTFQDISWGLRALIKVLDTKIGNGLDTVSEIIYSYAPPSENDTEAYLSRVLTVSGFTRNQVIQPNSASLTPLMKGIINVEIGSAYAGLITDADINEGFSLLGWEITPGVAAGGLVGALLLFGFGLYLLSTMPKPKRA